MPRTFADTVARQRYLEESYDKERDMRLAWYFKTKQRDTGEGPKTSRQYEVFRRRLVAGCPQPTKPLRQALEEAQGTDKQRDSEKDKELHEAHQTDRQQDTEKDKEETEERKSELRLPPIDMMPVNSVTRCRLYDGISKEGRGRASYLRDRYDLLPEHRYRFPVVSSWEYGWRLNDTVHTSELKNSIHARNRIISDTFYQRNGLPGLRTSVM